MHVEPRKSGAVLRGQMRDLQTTGLAEPGRGYCNEIRDGAGRDAQALANLTVCPALHNERRNLPLIGREPVHELAPDSGSSPESSRPPVPRRGGRHATIRTGAPGITDTKLGSRHNEARCRRMNFRRFMRPFRLASVRPARPTLIAFGF